MSFDVCICTISMTIKIENTYVTPKGSLYPFIVNPLPCLQSLAAMHLFSVSIGMLFLLMSYKWNHIVYNLLCLFSFS